MCPFGAFVDIGVGKDALIHNSKMGGRTVRVTEKVDVIVVTIDLPKDRIGLQLVGSQV